MSKDSAMLLQRFGPSSPASRLCCCLLLTLFFLSGFIALLLYLLYRPSKPHFSLVAAAIFNLSNSTSASPATALNTNMQFTVSIRNPSTHASIRYDRLSAYISYRDQAITPPAQLPSMFQEKDSTVAVSPVLGGEAVPVSTEVIAGLMTDENFGVVGMRLVVMGRLKYKTGAFHSGWNGLYVRCDMLVGVKKGVAGQVPLLGGTSECDATV